MNFVKSESSCYSSRYIVGGYVYLFMIKENTSLHNYELDVLKTVYPVSDTDKIELVHTSSGSYEECVSDARLFLRNILAYNNDKVVERKGLLDFKLDEMYEEKDSLYIAKRDILNLHFEYSVLRWKSNSDQFHTTGILNGDTIYVSKVYDNFNMAIVDAEQHFKEYLQRLSNRIEETISEVYHG